jgi:methionyl-tRNA formyltransferase
MLAQKIDVLGISVRYHKLFKEEYYSVFKPGIINLHGGELPKFRGANIANYAILENVSQAGGTLHYINQGIDEGDIVERVLFEVTEKLTAFEYFSKTLLALQEAFKLFIYRPDVIDSTAKINCTPQSEYIAKGEKATTYYKKGIEKNRITEFTSIGNWDELYRLARAYTFPGHQGLIIKNGEEFVEIKAMKSDTSS